MSEKAARLIRERGVTPPLNSKEVTARYGWLLQRGMDCILSPDADGFACGLLMSHHLGWNIRGFYDGKVLAFDNCVRPSDCVFLDIEIGRAGVRSVGQHMIRYDRAKHPPNWFEFDNCLSINELRNYDFKNLFTLKYPFGTTHALIAILQDYVKIDLGPEHVAPLLHIDGTFKVLFGYVENQLDWLDFLGVKHPTSAMNEIFLKRKWSLYEITSLMRTFWEERDSFSLGNERGDRLAISLRGGTGRPHNLREAGGVYQIDNDAAKRAIGFISLVGRYTGWRYNASHWHWNDWNVIEFEKGTIKPSLGRYNNVLNQRPLSLAFTSTQAMEYTLDPNGYFY